MKNITPKIGFILALLSLTPSSVNAQAPGGVASPKYWYHTRHTNWQDVYSGTNKFNGPDTLSINFHPALRFRKQAPQLIQDLNLHNEQMIFGVYHPEYAPSQVAPESKQFLQLRYHNGDYTTLEDNAVIRKVNFPRKEYAPDFVLDNATIAKESALTVFGFPSGTAVSNSIWGTDPDTLVFSFSGYIPELIIYDRKLNVESLERERIESYLAIKYAIPLDLNKHSYIGSDQKLLLKKNDMNAFGRRICAIGRADASGLWQYQSSTSYEETNLSYLYHAGVGNSDSANNRSLTIGFTNHDKTKIPDNAFLFWGDDNAEVKTIDTLLRIGTYVSKAELIKRSWLMYNGFHLGDYTSVQVSGKLMGTLLKKEYAYFLLKKENPLSKKSFYLLEDSTAYLYKDSIAWETAMPFTFGRVPKLRDVQVIVCHMVTEADDSTEYVHYREFLIKRKGGYKYRNSKTEVIKNCDPVYSYFPGTKIISKQVEVYFKGGVAPFEVKLYNSSMQVVESTEKTTTQLLEIRKPANAHTHLDEEVKVCIISTDISKSQLNKNYHVVITDAINQVISIPVIIK